jgi:hypothetical protein
VEPHRARGDVCVVAEREEGVAHHLPVELGNQRRERGIGSETVGSHALVRERTTGDPDVIVEVVGHLGQNRRLVHARGAHEHRAHERAVSLGSRP